MPRQLDDVAPRRRLAAGEVHVQRAERRGFAEDALPGLGVELGRGPFERHRVRAMRAAQRAAMGELDQNADRRPGRRWNICGHVSRTLLAFRSPSMAATSFSITASGAL